MSPGSKNQACPLWTAAEKPGTCLMAVAWFYTCPDQRSLGIGGASEPAWLRVCCPCGCAGGKAASLLLALSSLLGRSATGLLVA